jgi:carotenoid cleavage dioxygenase-like enzyme
VHEAIFRSQPEEHASSSLAVTGEIPGALRGTFLRSGPGLLEVGSDTLNFFDGYALIAGVSFADGRATFRSRHLRTPLFAAETAARAMTIRRAAASWGGSRSRGASSPTWCASSSSTRRCAW